MSDVHVAIIENTDAISMEMCEELSRFISSERLDKAGRYYFVSDRANCIVSYVLLRYLLCKFYDIKTVPAFEYNYYGKPYLSKCKDRIYFNISHCKGAAVCAAARIEVGIDIQDYSKDDSEIVSYVLSEKEVECISGCSNPAAMFAKLWSLKESYIKRLGTGISDELHSYDFSDIESRCVKYGFQFDVIEGEKYFLSLCAEPKCKINLEKLSIKELLDGVKILL